MTDRNCWRFAHLAWLLLLLVVACSVGGFVDSRTSTTLPSVGSVSCEVVAQKQVVDTIEGRSFVLIASNGVMAAVPQDEWELVVIGSNHCSSHWVGVESQPQTMTTVTTTTVTPP